jgi:hypothetical protein
MGREVQFVVQLLVVRDPLVKTVLLPILQIDPFDLEDQFLDKVVELNVVGGTFLSMSRGRPIAMMALCIVSDINSSPRYWR